MAKNEQFGRPAACVRSWAGAGDQTSALGVLCLKI